MLPIGVILPTRNAIQLLPEHLACMTPWLEHVEEVVVVDSESRDGTLERLQAELRHPNLRFFPHPPGLYQSWNFGIGKLRSEFCYVSTVGETISLEGLAHLVEVGREHQCDVVISRPRFVDLAGKPMPAPRWPVDDILGSLNATEPVVLEGARLFVFTLLNYRDAILGSSASNLYRTARLQARPFPVDYGTAGDGGWGLQHCLDVRVAATPEIFSSFREHPKSYSKAEYAVDQLARKKLNQVKLTYAENMRNAPGFAEIAGRLQIDRMIELLERHHDAHTRLEAAREGSVPWILNPRAWSARTERSRLERELESMKIDALRILAKS